MKIYYDPIEDKISLDSLAWKNKSGEVEFGLGYWNLNEEESPDWCSISITKDNQYYYLFLKKQPKYYYRDYQLISKDIVVFQNLREIEKDQNGKWSWKK